MNQDSVSLDRLHDLVLPTPVSWWPPAPGWYVVFGIVFFLVLFIVYRSWNYWRSNAYRRAALRQLASLEDAAAIVEVLRRTALAIMPRSVVAEMTGADWADWLTSQCSEAMSSEVRQLLTAGVYRRASGNPDISALRDYAAHWITHHRFVLPDAGGNG